MTSKTMLAMLLIALGIVALAYGGIASWSRQTVLDVGNSNVTSDQTHPVPLPPLAGALAIGVGAILLIMNVRKPALAGARS